MLICYICFLKLKDFQLESYFQNIVKICISNKTLAKIIVSNSIILLNFSLALLNRIEKLSSSAGKCREKFHLRTGQHKHKQNRRRRRCFCLLLTLKIRNLRKKLSLKCGESYRRSSYRERRQLWTEQASNAMPGQLVALLTHLLLPLPLPAQARTS